MGPERAVSLMQAGCNDMGRSLDQHLPIWPSSGLDIFLSCQNQNARSRTAHFAAGLLRTEGAKTDHMLGYLSSMHNQYVKRVLHHQASNQGECLLLVAVAQQSLLLCRRHFDE